uniref:Uncharacterized protein n=1 Tax=Salix viminalis TaxID=40686 RepID=A0A6N2K6Z6_SALVM
MERERERSSSVGLIVGGLKVRIGVFFLYDCH